VPISNQPIPLNCDIPFTPWVRAGDLPAPTTLAGGRDTVPSVFPDRNRLASGTWGLR
jgi:hypothetical protein